MWWCAGDAGDAAIKAAFEEVVAPALHRFAPDIILVSYSKHIPCAPVHCILPVGNI